jgi:hypothetical protein
MSFALHKATGSISPGTELVRLEELNGLMDAVCRLLSGDRAEELPEVSCQVERSALEVAALLLRARDIPVSPEIEVERRKQFSALRERRSFCRAMLRRWRRAIKLRQQLLRWSGDPMAYDELVGC